MIQEKIENIIINLRELSHKLSKEDWNRVRLICNELKDAAYLAGQMEKKLVIKEEEKR